MTSEIHLSSSGWGDVSAAIWRLDVVSKDEGVARGASLVEVCASRATWAARKSSITFRCEVRPGCAALLASTSFVVGTGFLRTRGRLSMCTSSSPSLRIRPLILVGCCKRGCHMKSNVICRATILERQKFPSGQVPKILYILYYLFLKSRAPWIMPMLLTSVINSG